METSAKAATLETMLNDLKALPGAVVVMDAGIATEANLVWLKEHNYHYVVVSRQRARQFEMEKSIEVQTAGQTPVHVQRVQEPGADEVKLYCYSPPKAEKDLAIDTTKAEKFEAELQKACQRPQPEGGNQEGGQTQSTHRPPQGKICARRATLHHRADASTRMKRQQPP